MTLQPISFHLSGDDDWRSPGMTIGETAAKMISSRRIYPEMIIYYSTHFSWGVTDE